MSPSGHQRRSLCPQKRTFSCGAITVAMGQERHFAVRKSSEPIGVVNAQMNASGQSKPPVAIPTQLAAFMAAASGCPHFRASCPGNCPNLTMTITATAIRMANTKKGKCIQRAKR
jgi:hypothetical protein